MPTVRVPVEPAVLEWAVRRSGLDPEQVSAKAGLRDLELWVRQQKLPTYKQLQALAAATYTPFGYFFLSEPPTERIPIPDFRIIGNAEVSAPSPNLLDTISLCEQRQDWYREYEASQEAEHLPFVGSATTESSTLDVAQEIRENLHFSMDDRRRYSSWDVAFRQLIDLTEDIGILVMVSGIVGNNTHRALDYNEFRGFALSDQLAPVVFVNATDTKAAQIFTLVHEIAHIWLGQSALTDSPMDRRTDNAVETWCNKVAAEVLVPIDSLRHQYRAQVNESELDRLAKFYKTSTLVVLRRIFDCGFIEWNNYRQKYEEEWRRIERFLDSRRAEGGGGNFYYTQPLRVSRRFASAVISDTLAGRTLHRDAYRLIGTRKHDTFVQLGEQVGVS